MDEIKKALIAYLDLLSEEELYILFLMIRELARK